MEGDLLQPDGFLFFGSPDRTKKRCRLAKGSSNSGGVRVRTPMDSNELVPEMPITACSRPTSCFTALARPPFKTGRGKHKRTRKGSP